MKEVIRIKKTKIVSRSGTKSNKNIRRKTKTSHRIRLNSQKILKVEYLYVKFLNLSRIFWFRKKT